MIRVILFLLCNVWAASAAQTTFKIMVPEYVEIYEQVETDSLRYVAQGTGVFTFKLMKYTPRVDLIVVSDSGRYSLTLLAHDRRIRLYYVWVPADLVLNSWSNVAIQ